MNEKIILNNLVYLQNSKMNKQKYIEIGLDMSKNSSFLE